MLGTPPSINKGVHNFLSKGVQYGTKKGGFSYKNLVVSIINSYRKIARSLG